MTSTYSTEPIDVVNSTDFTTSTDVDDSADFDLIDFRPLFDEVLQDLIRIMHCHSCGKKSNVSFFGYVGENCSKRCWSAYGDNRTYDAHDDCIGHNPETCKWCCTSDIISKAHSSYHTYMRNVWPMLDISVPCENECIKTMPTIKIKGYND